MLQLQSNLKHNQSLARQTLIQDNGTTSSVLPVQVYNNTFPGLVIETYDGSDSCLMQEKLMTQLKFPTSQSQLKAKTLLNSTLINCSKMHDDIIKGLIGKEIELPSKIFS